MEKLGIILLGSTNDANGELSSVARERCDRAILEYRQHPEALIIPTGGWGDHFNTTAKAHGHYLRDYLLAQGIPDHAIGQWVESLNKLQDSKLTRAKVNQYGIQRMIIVTSDFHTERARFLFSREFPGFPIHYVSSTTHLPESELDEKIAHEIRALKKLRTDTAGFVG